MSQRRTMLIFVAVCAALTLVNLVFVVSTTNKVQDVIAKDRLLIEENLRLRAKCEGLDI